MWGRVTRSFYRIVLSHELENEVTHWQKIFKVLLYHTSSRPPHENGDHPCVHAALFL